MTMTPLIDPACSRHVPVPDGLALGIELDELPAVLEILRVMAECQLAWTMWPLLRIWKPA